MSPKRRARLAASATLALGIVGSGITLDPTLVGVALIGGVALIYLRPLNRKDRHHGAAAPTQ